MSAFVITKKGYDTWILNGELDFEKVLESTVTASLVVTLLYHPENLVPLSKTRCIIINNAVWSQNHTALLKIMPSARLDRRHYLQ